MKLRKKDITRDQSRDTGMALTLLLLILFSVTRNQGLFVAAIVVHVVNMTAPSVYKMPAVLWLGLSELLGTVMSKILLGLVFMAVVVPIGVIRRIAGKDSLKLRAFRGGDGSVMLERNHLFTARDIEKPY